MRKLRTLPGAQQLRQWYRPLPRWKKVVSIMMIVLILCTPIAASFVVIHVSRSTTQSSGGTPHSLDPNQGTSMTIRQPTPPNLPAFTPAKQSQSINRPNNGPHPSFTIKLAPDHPAVGKSKDGRLTVAVPAGAVTSADLGAQQTLSLQVTEVAPSSGSSAGGSGVVSLGKYTMQLVDASGKPLSHGLRTPATLTLSYGTAEAAFDLAHAFAVLDGPTSTGSIPVTLDKGKHTLSVHLPADGSLLPHKAGDAVLQSPPWTTAISWDTYSLVATFGSPDPLNTGLNAGGFTKTIPLDIPSGPGGTAPPLTLQYSSAGVSEQHSPQAPAGWVGEGWNLGMASISWSERNVQADPTNSMWESQWMLTDPSGTSTELIPPTLDESTYFDDTGNAFNTAPLQWHDARENYAAIYSFSSPVTLSPNFVNPPCFRVFLPDGGMEEYGCTTDSLQYSDLYHPVKWLLDMRVDSSGNQIHYTYTNDMEPDGSGHQYPRDSVLQSIAWDSPACVSTSTRCTGASWNPLLQVAFTTSHTVAHPTNTPTSCNTTTNARCDDPLNLSATGGLPISQVMSTWVLNAMDIETAVIVNGSPAWSILTHYLFSYEQSGPSTITDPVTNRAMSTAGYLDLTQVQEIGQDFQTALPPITMSYSTQTEFYEDGAFRPQSATNCGPTWNTGGNGGGCDLWSQSYGGNSRYLSTLNAGDGAVESLTWANARNNTHGSAQPADPLYCDTHQSGYPCNSADDQAWSHIVVQEDDVTVNRLTQNGQGGAQTTTPITSKQVYTYQLSYPLMVQECADCVAGMYWGDQSDGDFLDFYNTKFMGFTKVSVSHSDGSMEVHFFNATEGIGVYDTTKVSSCPGNLPPFTPHCHASPWSSSINVEHGLETEVTYYNTDGSPLEQISNGYQEVCPPAGVNPSPQYTNSINFGVYGPWNGELVSELDHGNPVAVCDVQPTEHIREIFNGTLSTWPISTNTAMELDTYSYDSLGRLTQVNQYDVGGAGSGSPTQVVNQFSYVWTSTVNTSLVPVQGTYLLTPIAQVATQDGNGNRVYCEQRVYDGNPYVTGNQSNGFRLSAGSLTDIIHYTSCGTPQNNYTPQPQGRSVTSYAYDTAKHGNLIGVRTPDNNAGLPGAQSTCTGSDNLSYNLCFWYDAPSGFLSTGQTNGGLSSSIGYEYAEGNNLWPTNFTDANGQVTHVDYDPLGRPTFMDAPGDTGFNQTQTYTYANWCTGSGAQTPCVETDINQRVTTTSTVTTRSFYDGLGHLVETRRPGPAGSGHDVVQYFLYDVMGRQVGQSVSYFVSSYTGAAGSAAFSIPDSTQLGTTTAYDGLGRTTRVTDPMSHVTVMSYLTVCGVLGTPDDTGCYASTRVVDANQHQTETLVDGLGHTVYTLSYTGNTSATYAHYTTTMYTYDAAGRQTQTIDPLGSISRATYDTAGRETQLQDPDLGILSYGYDADGNLIMQSDPRGTAGTTYMGYDSLDRQIWTSVNSNGSSPLATWQYDNSTVSNYGKGHVTSETFTDNGVSGGYAYTYDARGRQSGWQMQIGPDTTHLQTYPFTFGYNDANQQINVSDNNDLVDDMSILYDANDWFSGVTDSPYRMDTITFASGLTYQGLAGASGLPTSAQVGNSTYTWNFSYNNLLNPTETQVKLNSNNSALYDQVRTFDAVGNLQTMNTTLPGGTDDQRFCYDELNRLTWAGSTGSAPCGTLSSGTLTSANYTQSFNYDQNNRLTSGPLGDQQYNDSDHQDAVTSVGDVNYSSQYDAAGDMLCRQAVASTACSSTNNGQIMTYDPLRRLTSWQNLTTGPTQTAQYAYDGEGRRVQQTLTSSSGTTVTQYIGPYAEVFTTGGVTSGTLYFNAGVVTVVKQSQSGALSYLVNNQLGSTDMALSTSGTVTAAQLFTPYGSSRYNSGVMPTNLGFTGQRGDPSGLIYMNARYYDPLVGQFTSADSVQGPNRYGYVSGNPTTHTDPSGHRDCDDCEDSGGGDDGSFDPVEVDPDPGQMNSDPNQMNSDPNQMNSDPNQMNSDPNQMNSDPNQMDPDPNMDNNGSPCDEVRGCGSPDGDNIVNASANDNGRTAPPPANDTGGTAPPPANDNGIPLPGPANDNNGGVITLLGSLICAGSILVLNWILGGGRPNPTPPAGSGYGGNGGTSGGGGSSGKY